MSQDFKQNNAPTEHTDFQGHGAVSKAQAVPATSLGLPLPSGKPFLTAQHDTLAIGTSFGARASSQISALCQDDHTSFFPSDVLFYWKALSKLRYQEFSTHWYLGILHFSHRCTDSTAQSVVALEIRDTSPGQ